MGLNPSWPVNLNLQPAAVIGPRLLKTTPTLAAVTGGAGAAIDLSQDSQAGNIGAVQAVYLDTSNFNYTLTLTHRTTGFPIRVRANTQGWYPIPATDDLKFDVLAASGAAGQQVPIWFTNAVMAAAQWQTA